MAGRISNKLTWNQVKENWLDKIDIIEDPIYSSYVETNIFIEMYGKLLDELDGSDSISFFSFYFEPSPLNNSIYLFKDEEVKQDFCEFARELKLIPELIEIMEGESTLDKEIRKQSELKYKKIKCPQRASEKRSQQVLKTLDKLRQRLENETDPYIRSNIQKKITNTLRYIEKTT